MSRADTLILVGPTGAGKTCIGQRLAAHYGLRAVDADHEIEQRAGARVTAIFEREGEAGFRARERDVLAALLATGDMVLATGGGAVLDPGNRRLLHGHGFVVYLQVSPRQQLQRLAQDRSRPLLARPDREAVLEEMARVRGPLYAEVADLRFDTDRLSASQVTAQLLPLLQRQWRPGPATAGPSRRTM